MKIQSVRRTSDNLLIAERVIKADSILARFLGLMGKPSLTQGEGLWLEPCNSIHTFFMRFPIDVVYINGLGEVLVVYSKVQPWRMHLPIINARAVLELPAGSASSLRKGDTICLS